MIEHLCRWPESCQVLSVFNGAASTLLQSTGLRRTVLEGSSLDRLFENTGGALPRRRHPRSNIRAVFCRPAGRENAPRPAFEGALAGLQIGRASCRETV